MECESSAPRSRPLLLLGRRGPSLTELSGSDALRSCFQVATPRDAEVAPLARVLRPTAVLLESSEFYLDGRRVHSTLKRCAPETRVLFLDLEGRWAMWIEIESEETCDLRIAPCEMPDAGVALLELLKEPGSPAARLASAG